MHGSHWRSVLAFAATAFAVLLRGWAGQLASGASIEYLGENRQAGLSAAVVVDGHRVAQTAQLLPLDKQGRLIGEGSVEAQLAQAFFNLAHPARVGTQLAQLALHYLQPSQVLPVTARKLLEKRLQALQLGSVAPALFLQPGNELPWLHQGGFVCGWLGLNWGLLHAGALLVEHRRD